MHTSWSTKFYFLSILFMEKLLLLQNSWVSSMKRVSPPSITDGKIVSALSRADTLSIWGMLLIRGFMPIATITTKYGAIGYAIHELGKQSHMVNALESFWIGVITGIGTPFVKLHERGFSSETIASLLVVGVIGYVLFFTRLSKFNFIGKDVSRLAWDSWFAFQYLSKTFAQYRNDGDKKSFKKKIRKYFNFYSFRWLHYFNLSKLERELVLSGDLEIVTLYMKVAEYFHKTYQAWLTGFENRSEDWFVEFRLYRPKGMKEETLAKLSQNDLLHSIWLDVNKYTLKIYVANEIVLKFVVKQAKKEVNLEEFLPKMTSGNLYLGVNDRNELVSYPIQLSHANHIGVFWMTGQGKSIFNSGLLYSMYMNNSDWNFSFADVKWDCSFAQGVKRIRYASEVTDILSLTNQKVMLVKDIHAELKRVGARNLEEYMKNTPKSEQKSFMKPEFFIIEEFSYLIDAIKELEWIQQWMGILESANFIMNVRALVQIGRSAGFSVLLSLQKPISESLGNSTIIKDMIRPISFKTQGTGEVLTFNQKTGLELDKLSIGEAVYMQDGEFHKFRSFNVSQKFLNTLKENFPENPKSLPDEYFEYARWVWRFCFDDADMFGLTRKQFDTLSKKCQEDWILIKRSNNSLEFTD